MVEAVLQKTMRIGMVVKIAKKMNVKIPPRHCHAK
jgi:hypothetical protein